MVKEDKLNEIFQYLCQSMNPRACNQIETDALKQNKIKYEQRIMPTDFEERLKHEFPKLTDKEHMVLTAYCFCGKSFKEIAYKYYGKKGCENRIKSFYSRLLSHLYKNSRNYLFGLYDNKDILDKSVWDDLNIYEVLDVNLRIKNSLIRNGIRSISQLDGKKLSELMMLQDIGKKSIRKLQADAARIGLTLVDDISDKPAVQNSKLTDVQQFNKLFKKQDIIKKLLIMFDKHCTLSQTVYHCNDYSRSDAQEEICKRCRMERLGLTSQEDSSIFLGEITK